MSDLHIDDFYRDAGLMLARLYASFPLKNTLYVEDISGPDTPDEFGLHSDRFSRCFSTMLWLADSGYVRYESVVRQEALDQVVLTERGFLLLSSRCQLPHLVQPPPTTPPSVVEETSTNIHRLRQALKSRDSIEIRHIMLFLLDHSRQYR